MTLDMFLSFNHSNCHLLDKCSACLRMIIGSVLTWAIHENITTVEEFAYVSSIIFGECEFSTWMLSLKSTGMEH